MSSYLDNLLNRAKSLVWDEQPPEIVPDQRTSVRADSFDELAYKMLRDVVPNLDESINEVKADHDYVEPAYEDLFNLLHQGDPMFKDARTMEAGYDANHEMLKEMAGTDEFQQLREQTAYDEWGTAFAMLALQPKMIDAFDRVKEAREQRAEAQAAAQAAQQALQAAMDAAGAPGADPAAAGQALSTAMNDAAGAQAALDEAQGALDDQNAQAGQDLATAAAQAEQALDEQNAQAQAYGVGGGELKRMPWNERRALTKLLDQEKLKRLAALCGQFRRYGDAERRKKIKHAPSVIVDVELGSDLTKLVADEFVRLAVPELEDLFWLDFAGGGLMQWVEEGPEQAGQGPIIVVCDESGSMGCGMNTGRYDYGDENNEITREMWSKALSMALADQAKRGKRDFIYIGFASNGQVWEKHFPNGEIPLEGVIEFATHFFDGGTSYTQPLSRAREIIGEYAKSGKPKPDIVFITDDDCSISQTFVEKWAATKADIDMTCYGIQVGATQVNSTMRKLCDKTILLSALNANPEGMTELFRTI